MTEVGKPNSGTNLRINVYDANAEGLEAGALEGLRAIMACMRAKSFIRDYKLDADDYDRQSWDEGYTIELQASVYEPGTCVWRGWVGGSLRAVDRHFHPQVDPPTNIHPPPHHHRSFHTSHAGRQHAVHRGGLPLPPGLRGRCVGMGLPLPRFCPKADRAESN